MDCVFGVGSKNSSPLQGMLGFLLFIFWESRHLHFTRSVIYLESIFVKDVMSMSRFSFCVWMFSCSQHHLLKRWSLSHCIAFVLCQRSVDCIYGGLFLGSLFCPLIFFFFWSHLLPVLCCFDYWSFIVNPDVL